MTGILDKAYNLIGLAVLAYCGFTLLRYATNPWAIAAIVGALALLPFVAGPILIHRTLKLDLNPGLIPFDPEGPASPPELIAHFRQTADDLDRLGFSPQRYYQAKMRHAIVDGWVLLFRNAKTGETARIITSAGENDFTRLGTSLAVLVSEFSDGTVVATSNRTTVNIYPRSRPPYHGRPFPQVRDVEQLVTVHRARVANHAPGGIALDPARDDPDGYIRRVDFEEPYAHQVACGYHYNDEMEGLQRLTWKGAILGAWKLTPPFNYLILTRERLSAARQLSNLKAGRPVD